VDTHVHRISNRWGYVQTKTPEETEMALRAKLPQRYWIEINDLLVAMGQTICHPTSPKCSLCPIERSCAKVGVVRSR
jgi:endonuclease-3